MAYVYRHIRTDTNKPFYIGIGTLPNYKRARTITRRNPFWRNIIKKTDWYYEIMFDDVSLEEAFEKEKEFIKIYGRADLNKGSLVNLTDGGDGTLGHKRSEENIKKLADFNRNRKLPADHRAKIAKANTGKIRSDEAKKKMSESAKGRKASPETRVKMSLQRIGNKSNTGKKLPESQKLKMKEAQRKRREREKIIKGKVV